MNQNILIGLERQAEKLVQQIPAALDSNEYTSLFNEKFAELIVRECAQAAAQTPCPYEDEFAKQTYGHTWDMACVESAKTIRKHFGVRE